MPGSPDSPSEDFGESVAIVLLGMLAPVLVGAAGPDRVTAAVPGDAFTALGAGGFGVAAWLLLEARDLDRPNFLAASVVAPAVFVVAILTYGMATGGGSFFRYLFGGSGLFTYPAAFGAAGFGAVALSRIAS